MNFFLAGGAAALALGAMDAVVVYGCVAPQSQICGKTFLGDGDPNHLALTFDDGPNDNHTERLLGVLKEHGVRATFFLVGKYVRQRPQLVRSIFADGHSIGNHTFNHYNLLRATTAQLHRELSDTESAIEDAIGKTLPEPRLVRPPWGFRRPDTLASMRRLRMVPVMWSVTCFDWHATTAERVEGHAVRRISRRGGPTPQIILLHDGGHVAMGADRSATVDATGLIIRRYHAEGRKFLTIPEMMADQTAPFQSRF